MLCGAFVNTWRPQHALPVDLVHRRRDQVEHRWSAMCVLAISRSSMCTLLRGPTRRASRAGLECRRQVKLTLAAVKGQNSVAVDMNHYSIEMMESRCSCTTVCK